MPPAVAFLVLLGCSHQDNATSDTARATDSTRAATASSSVPSTGPTVAPAPITGRTYTVKAIGDDNGYRFNPANITIKQGDGVKWVVVSGTPHNVTFDSTDLAPDVRAQLDANMPDKMTKLTGNLKLNIGDTYTISFAKVKPGKYSYHCMPHFAFDMKGVITVQ